MNKTDFHPQFWSLGAVFQAPRVSGQGQLKRWVAVVGSTNTEMLGGCLTPRIIAPYSRFLVRLADDSTVAFGGMLPDSAGCSYDWSAGPRSPAGSRFPDTIRSSHEK